MTDTQRTDDELARLRAENYTLRAQLAAERERCAKLVEDDIAATSYQSMGHYRQVLAATIRKGPKQ